MLDKVVTNFKLKSFLLIKKKKKIKVFNKNKNKKLQVEIMNLAT